jgi:hypothetical protein
MAQVTGLGRDWRSVIAEADALGLEPREYDSTQEIRAMILAALPYPPLPILLPKLDASGEDVLQTSHDLISMLLRESCAKRTVSENQARMQRQQAALAGFMRDLGGEACASPVELYRIYCAYTMHHIATYLPPGAPPPALRFLPLDHPCKGDKTHRAMCDYMAAQARILELPDGQCAENWLRYEYFDMLLFARGRLINEADAEPAEAE